MNKHHHDEQAEAAIVDVILSALQEHYKGSSLKVSKTYTDDTDELVITVEKGARPRLKLRFELKV